VIAPILRSRLIEACGRAPVLGPMLRARAREFDEGSVVTIRSGVAAGLRWRRYQRFVNAYWLGNYELDVQLALRRLLRVGDVFYDVGANAGFFTILAGRLVGPRGKVFAFEPVPESAEALREHVALNGFSWCEVVPFAVGARRATRTLSYEPEIAPMARFGKKRTASELEINVEVVTLDDFAVGHSAPSLTKVDVEGAEVEVLEGAASTIEHGTVVLLELHGTPIAGDAIRLLGRAGYEFQGLDGSPVGGPEQRTHVVAIRPVVRTLDTGTTPVIRSQS